MAPDVSSPRTALAPPRLDRVRMRRGDQFIVMHRGGCAVVANLAGQTRRVGLDEPAREVLLATEPGLILIRGSVELPPHSAAVVRC